MDEFPVEQRTAPLTARGFVRFIKLRPERKISSWVCDECYTVVIPSKFLTHARNHRG